MNKSNEIITSDYLQKKEVLNLIRLSIYASVVICVTIITTLYLILTMQIEIAISGILMFLFISLKIITKPKSKFFNHTLSLLAGISPGLVAIADLILLSNPITWPIGIGIGMGVLGGVGAIYINQSSRNALNHTNWKIFNKINRVLTWNFIYRNGWEMIFPNDTEKIHPYILDDKEWQIKKKFENNKGAEIKLSISIDTDNPNVKIIENSENKYPVESNILATIFRINSIDNKFYVKQFQNKTNYFIVLSTKWLEATTITLELKKLLANDELLMEYSQGVKMNNISEVFYRILPPDNIQSLDKNGEAVHEKIKLLEELNYKLFELMKQDKFSISISEVKQTFDSNLKFIKEEFENKGRLGYISKNKLTIFKHRYDNIEREFIEKDLITAGNNVKK